MRGAFWQDGESVNSTSLIVSLLVRYPEIATVSFDPETRALQITFVLSHPLSDEQFEAFKVKIETSVDVFLSVSGRERAEMQLAYTNFERNAFLEIRRDVNSLSQEEISLLLELVTAQFGEVLVRDQADDLGEEDLEVQEELIDHMLEDLKDSRQDKTLIGFREEGRVLVFNRSVWHDNK